MIRHLLFNLRTLKNVEYDCCLEVVEVSGSSGETLTIRSQALCSHALESKCTVQMTIAPAWLVLVSCWPGHLSAAVL